ncbi:hypothetical protein Tsubulata_017969 [Turnera subulata]|uniref:Uncharacterized protein n=1 Tax=Turnera subulata TaxID=218843 RepID=A0A9Q0FJK6_9ROSI|nr:hypothetical protein Tsubulata_017969 [Turnera subulata]
METEEEENPNLQNPSLELHNESNINITATAAGAASATASADEEKPQHELPNTEPECETEPVTDSPEPQLATGDSAHLPQAETAVIERREDQDTLIGAEESTQPTSSSPLQRTVEEGGGELAGAAAEMEEVEPPVQPPQEVGVELEGDLVGGEESHGVGNSNEDTNAEVVVQEINEEIDNGEQAVADVGEGEDSEPVVRELGTETGTVGDVAPESEADTRNKEIRAETSSDAEAVADVAGGLLVETVSEGPETENQSETDAVVADAAEKLEDEAVREGTETEAASKTEPATDVVEELEAETVSRGVEAEIPLVPQVTDEAEDVKMEDMKGTEVVEGMEEVKAEMEMGAEEDEKVEKVEDGDQGQEMEATEQTEMSDAADEAVNETEEADEMEMVGMEGQVDKEEEMEEEAEEKGDEVEETETAEEMAEAEEETEEVNRSAGGKRKRGKNAKAPAKATPRKKVEEDVCFICFDGGELVLCDRRGCPKAYHPSCVNRDEAFFRSKGRWNCGWHLCSNCEKNSYYMCLTCTYSLCKGCIKDGIILCVRGNKGFCDTCFKTIMLIENEQGNKEMAQVDFDDKNSWEFLFKDYWIGLKERLSLTSEEVAQAKHPWKGSELRSGKQESPDDVYDAQNDEGSASDSSENAGSATPKRRKVKRRLKSRSKDKYSPSTARNWDEDASGDESTEWASKELLEFVMHMKNGDKSVCSQFDVQALLLDYIKRNKLRDPRRKSQIICDSRLENLFGKPRVGHFEMLKLLESHFLLKDVHEDDLQESVVDIEANQFEADENSDAFVKSSKDKKRKSRKKGDKRGLQSNVDDYAAIDMHNINLIYLRRNLVEELIDDTEAFNDKVVGSFVRIRISGSAQKQDLYRLVQVVGTSKAAEPYRVGKKMTNFLLEILNLNKTEVVSMDIISNQEFTEDECKRLRQSIKCGLINRLTVGDIQEKAMALQAVRVEDLLKSPEERRRRLEEIPEIHTDPKMDPSYESEEDEGEADDKKQETYLRPRGSSFNRRGREPISPRVGGSSPSDPWGGTRSYSSMNRELSRNMSGKGFVNRGDDAVGATETLNDNLWSRGREREMQQSQNWENQRIASNSDNQGAHTQISESVPRPKPEVSPTPAAAGITPSAAKINESDKIWHYQDPSGKIQGPFSMVQLRKWNNTGYFPADLRIWRTTEKQDDSILLSDALNGNFQKEVPPVDTSFLKTPLVNSPHQSSLHSAHAVESQKPQAEIGGAHSARATPLQIPNYSANRWGSETNLPSPTPSQTPKDGPKVKAYESRWSPTPAQPAGSPLVANAPSGGSGELRRPAVIIPENDQYTHNLSSSAKFSGHSDGINMSPGVRAVPKAESSVRLGSGNAPPMLSQSMVPGESPRVLVNPHLHVTGSNGPSVNAVVDTKNLQSFVQSVTGNNTHAGSLGWGAASIPRPEMSSMHSVPGSGSQVWGNTPSQKVEPTNTISTTSQPGAYGNWGGATNPVHNSASSFPAVNPNTGWGQIPGNPNSVASPSFTPTNASSAARQGQENQNNGWGTIPGNPNMNLGGSLPANSNQGWAASSQGSALSTAYQGWGATGQGPRPGNTNSAWGTHQGQATATAFPGWVPPSGQGTATFNSNQTWVAPGQGPTGNASSGWTAPNSNTGQWGGDMNHNGERFTSQKDRNSHGGDSGYGAGKSWQRQSSSFSRGDSSRPPLKGQRICKFHENGHCKKGAQCDYLHS